MKIGISATGPSLDAEVDPRFGRCQYFIIADPEAMKFEALAQQLTEIQRRSDELEKKRGDGHANL